jgi:hypothetical protein
MNEISEKFVVLTITEREAKVWATGITAGTIPQKIYAPLDLNRHHFKEDPKKNGRGEGSEVPIYYREIIEAVSRASEILILGHGHGKASSMDHFVDYLERKHPDIARKVVHTIDANLVAMTEPEILATARKWFETRVRLGI